MSLNLTDLPNEMIQYIILFLTEYDIGQCRRVNRKLYLLCNDQHIIHQFPHVEIDGSTYFKEQVYYTPLLRNKALVMYNDIEWYISRLTPVMKKYGCVQTWAILIHILLYVVERAARKLDSDAIIMNHQNGTAHTYQVFAHIGMIESYSPVSKSIMTEINWSLLCKDIDMSRIADKCINLRNQLLRDVIQQSVPIILDTSVHILSNTGSDITPFTTDHDTFYIFKICQCMVYLNINKDIISYIHDMVIQYGDPEYPKLDTVPINLQHNPWIRQYVVAFEDDMAHKKGVGSSKTVENQTVNA
jgi:hypothetical protein